MTPFKNRVLDLARPVRLYRNLHKKPVSFSVQQGGKVVAHCTYLVLKNCTFIVSEPGRQRVIKEKRKNVHAFVKGFLSHVSTIYQPRVIRYNPYFAGYFFDQETNAPISRAKYVMFKNGLLTASSL